MVVVVEVVVVVVVVEVMMITATVKQVKSAAAPLTRLQHLLQNQLRMLLHPCSPRRIWMQMPSVPYRRVHWDRRLRTGASHGKNV